MRLYVCLFVGVLVASGAAAQTTAPPRDAARAAPAATATIRGRVTDLESGRPLAEASVMIVSRSTVFAMGGQDGAQAWTDADGRYTISGLAPGDYYVAAGPPEFTVTHLPRAFGASSRFLLGTRDLSGSLELKAGEHRDNIDFALVRSRAIEGRVFNESGDPLASVMVTVELPGSSSMGGAVGIGMTDDRGMFRVFGLPPGAFRVCVLPEGRSPALGAADTLGTRLVRTCYPAAVVEASAETIAVNDQDVAGVVIHVQRTGTFTASGRIVDEAGAIVRNADVSFMKLTSHSSSAYPVETRGGVFTARGLTPGDYVIRATVGDAAEGYYPLRVETSDITDVVVPTSAGATVSGRLLFPADVPRPRSRPVVQMRWPADRQRIYSRPPKSASTKEDGTFEFRGLHGPLLLTVSALPPGWVVQSVRYRGTDVTDQALEFQGTNHEQVDVLLSNRSARLSVRVIDEAGRSALGQVFLLPTDPARWRGGIMPYSRPFGQAEEQPLRAGDYLVVALPVEELMRAWEDPSFVEKLAKVAQTITLAAGEHRKIDVRVTPLAGAR